MTFKYFLAKVLFAQFKDLAKREVDLVKKDIAQQVIGMIPESYREIDRKKMAVSLIESKLLGILPTKLEKIKVPIYLTPFKAIFIRSLMEYLAVLIKELEPEIEAMIDNTFNLLKRGLI